MSGGPYIRHKSREFHNLDPSRIVATHIQNVARQGVRSDMVRGRGLGTRTPNVARASAIF